MKPYRGMRASIRRAAMLSTMLTWAVALGVLLLVSLLAGCASVAPEQEPKPEVSSATITSTKESTAPNMLKRIEVARQQAEAAQAERLKQANRVEACTITYYCCELRPHICGTGNGITASGAPVKAGVTCAVDPDLIPLGGTVWVDYGDGVLHEYTAQDVGGWVNGAHVDLAVATHDQALQLGRRKATVYWLEG